MSGTGAQRELIREHAFNSAWLGRRTGLIEDVAFFASPLEDRLRALDGFALVELRAPLSNQLPHAEIARTGFFLADTQLHFRIGLAAVAALPQGPSLAALEVVPALAEPFTVRADEMAPFQHERFLLVPGVSQEKLAERYARWSNELIEKAPRTCVRLVSQGKTQGWFLSEPDGGLLRLALAMAHRGAAMSGMLLYQRALAHYGATGHRVGHAGFSVSNTSVHNVYARLGAQFTAPEGRWLWVTGARP
ncbi:MAG: hypothetical protein JST92_14180 [Deltaproteobacteria bacterium]|nr:hypothetical protein [Deltaproteobacteria bacterium]